MPLPDVYGFLHAYMVSQGIECITPGEKAPREAAAQDQINAAMNF